MATKKNQSAADPHNVNVKEVTEVLKKVIAEMEKLGRYGRIRVANCLVALYGWEAESGLIDDPRIADQD